MCLDGASRAGADFLTAVPDAGLRVYFAWTPMLPADNGSAARLVSRPMADPRASHYWDPQRHLGRRLAAALGITATDSMSGHLNAGIAWAVYLAYSPGPRSIESPDFWMHQLGDLQRAPRLDPGQWAEQVRRLIGA